ncbi:hypothetical protein [Anaerospora sp.]|uniref:hypothetical protein n=1 Tax=Anaerospora sp. TaxID=1960278 RepID=UPI00289890D4|nr:hypothetical protein [Anaerospora sp.]
MEKTSTRRKLRRKYKRYAAAVAGAAILTGAALPGVPVAKALAAENPYTPSNKTEQTTMIDKDTQKPVKKVVAEKESTKDRRDYRDSWRDRDRDRNNGWHEHKYSWPSADENQGWYENGRIYYRSDNYRNYSSDRYGYSHYLSSPVDAVKASAANYGFSRYNDSFTTISQSTNSATVQVTKNSTGKRFLVNLERDSNRDWHIISVRSL